jgi:DNA-binding NtrC family response regulator
MEKQYGAHKNVEIIGSRQGEILIVEDEVNLRTAFDHIIRSVDSKLVPIWVDSAEKALDLLRHQTFEFVIADYYLAGPRTGLQLWSSMHRRFPQIPFLLVSGMSTKEYLEKTSGLTHGPTYLAKPFTIEECRQAISSLIISKQGSLYVS